MLNTCLTAMVIGCTPAAEPPEPKPPRPVVMPWRCGKSISYPLLAQKKGFEGKVTLTFKVYASGLIGDIKVSQATEVQLKEGMAAAQETSAWLQDTIAQAFEKAAINSVQSCRFPAAPGLAPAAASVPIEFHL